MWRSNVLNLPIVDVMACIGLLVGVASIMAYRPLLMIRVRQHPNRKRSNATWDEVQTSLQRQYNYQGRLYPFIRDYAAMLNNLRIMGACLILLSLVAVFFPRLAH